MINIQLKDIAEKLGLSISTVSRAIQDKPGISIKTKKRVIELAQILNYQPNPHARSLRIKKTKTIAVLVPDISNHFFSLALKGVETIVHKEGFNLMIYQTNDDWLIEKKVLHLLETGLVDGILLSVSMNPQHNYSHIKQLVGQIPLVFFDRVVEDYAVPWVVSNNFISAYHAATHLTEKKCKKIYFIGIDGSISSIKERLSGFEKALADKNVKNAEVQILFYADNDEAYRELKTILIKDKKGIAFFCSVDRYALQLYKLCDELELNIPRDIRIISFSNNPYAQLLSAPLSVIVPPAFEMGKQAAEMIVDLINNKKVESNQVIFTNDMVFRVSTSARNQH
ncbi:LacI family DNA-binding transcriptional regulator [Ferruginibacter sp.]